jgi:hypothetical protein
MIPYHQRPVSGVVRHAPNAALTDVGYTAASERGGYVLQETE